MQISNQAKTQENIDSKSDIIIYDNIQLQDLLDNWNYNDNLDNWNRLQSIINGKYNGHGGITNIGIINNYSGNIT